MSPPSAPPDLPAFVRSLEAELHSRAVPFDLATLMSFASAVWPLARENPDPARWADSFLEAPSDLSPAGPP
jgi:hypothetical protein